MDSLEKRGGTSLPRRNHLNATIAVSVSTSQKQMGSLMRWCSYVRPASAGAAVCLYCGTEWDRKCEKLSWVTLSLSACLSPSVCADTHRRECVATLWDRRGLMGWITRNWLVVQGLMNSSPSLTHLPQSPAFWVTANTDTEHLAAQKTRRRWSGKKQHLRGQQNE